VNGDPKLAVDTSFIIALLNGAVRSTRSLRDVAFPVPVLGELRFGALGAKDPKRRLAEIERLAGGAAVLLSDGETARHYAELRHRLKTAGTPLPENDIWIAAVCLQHDLALLTLDRHFERVEGLRLASA
jgi:tRNA(fMet)-specific endonuclease VapC